MILQNISKAIREQHYYAIALEIKGPDTFN